MKKSELRELVRETIRKIGDEYVVYPEKGGKRLGTHSTRKAAEKQLTAIHLQQHNEVNNPAHYSEIDDIPQHLYHATYKPLLKSIKKKGLDTSISKKSWEDSVPGYVYLAKDPYVAYDYAETSETVPDDWIDEIVILKINTDKIDLSKLFIDQNVIDNLGDTLEYRGIIPWNALTIFSSHLNKEVMTPADPSKVSKKELKMGIEVEMEHTDDPKEAAKIALQHLAEDPEYYTKLASLGLEGNEHEPMNPGILKKRLGKLSCSKVRAERAKLKDKGTTYAKALQRYLNYHCQ